MVNEAENLVLEPLRAIREWQSKADARADEIIMRLGAIEHHTAGLNLSDAQAQNEIDRFKARLERLERRLKLSDN